MHRRRLASLAIGFAVVVPLAVGAAPARAGSADLAVLSGALNFPDGTPLADATLNFRYADLPAVIPAVTDANGHYSMLVAAGRPGELIVYAYDPTTSDSVATVPSTPALPWGSEYHVNQFTVPPSGMTRDITLPALDSILVRVIDDAGQGVVGAQVDCAASSSMSINTAPSGYLYIPCMGAQGLLTGPDGYLPSSVPFYRGVQWVPQPELTALDPTNPSNRQTQTIPTDTLSGTDVPVTLQLGPVGATGPLTLLTGVVQLAEGTPIQGATVRYSYPFTKVTTHTDAAGAYSLPVAPGLGELNVLSNDATDPYHPSWDPPGWWVTAEPTPALPYRLDLKADTFVVPPGGRSYDVTVPAVDAVTIRVVDADGAAVRWAKVTTPTRQSGSLAWTGGGASFTATPAGARGLSTDESGFVTVPVTMFDDSATGAPVQVTAVDPANPGNTVTQPVVVDGSFTPASPLTLSLPLAAGPAGPVATVTGHAFLPDGTPIAGALVRYLAYNTGAMFTTLTQADGTYSMTVTANQGGDIALYGNDPTDPTWWATAQPTPPLPRQFQFHTNIQSWAVPQADGTSSFDFPLPYLFSTTIRVVDAGDPSVGIAGARVYGSVGQTRTMFWDGGSGYYTAPGIPRGGLVTGADGLLDAPVVMSSTDYASGPVQLAAAAGDNPARIDFLSYPVTADGDAVLALPDVPAAPSTVAADTTSAPTSIDLTWTPDANTGGADLTGFTVTAEPAAQGASVRSATKTTSVGTLQTAATTASTTVTKTIYDPTALGTTVTGLAPGTTYVVSVRSMNPVGFSTPTIITASTGSVGASVPDAPTNVVAVAGDASATVSWTAGADNGSAIQQFTVTSSSGGKTCTGVSVDTSCTVTGLANGTAYAFTVVATNGVGDSLPSAASVAVTPVLTVHLSQPVPTATGFTVNVTNYDKGLKYDVATSAGKAKVGKAVGTVLPLTVAGLAPGASATVTVTASAKKTTVMSGTVVGTSLVVTGVS